MMDAGLRSPPALSPLDGVLKRAGAHMTEREGWLVAADFGSLASELAVSRAAAGLADVSSIGKFEVRGAEHALGAAHPPGRPLSAGRAALAGAACWCQVSPELLLVLGAPGASARVREELVERLAGHDLELTDVTSQRVALCLMGRVGREVLSRVGTREVAEGLVRMESVAGIPTLVVRQNARRWLLVAPAGDAAELWQVLSEAGAPLGLAHVGADALAHLLAAGDG
jgi:glycine cleavage system T protein (aminomethyltransferase)